MKKTITALLLASVAGFAFAQSSPVGLWKTIDDETGKEKSLVRITEVNGTLVGKIEKLINPSEPDPKCDKCTDDRKDKPITGMTIIRNARQDADDKGIWTGGEIMDPAAGKTYRARFKPVDGGKKLEMRGYIGPFFRTQTWIRVE